MKTLILLTAFLAGQSNPQVTLPDWYMSMAQRMSQETTAAAIADVTMLADLYENDPASRQIVSIALLGIPVERQPKGDIQAVLQPIVPTLIRHLLDSSIDAQVNGYAINALIFVHPIEALDPMITLASRTDVGTLRIDALRVVALFCQQSKQAVLTLTDAAAPGQPLDQRVIALNNIGEAARASFSGSGCRDKEWSDVVLAGLKSDQPDEIGSIDSHGNYSLPNLCEDDGHGHISCRGQGERPNVVRAAVMAAGGFGPLYGVDQSGPFIVDLKRIAADPNPKHHWTVADAKQTLSELQQPGKYERRRQSPPQ
jgi:hypothetical protein